MADLPVLLVSFHFILETDSEAVFIAGLIELFFVVYKLLLFL